MSTLSSPVPNRHCNIVISPAFVHKPEMKDCKWDDIVAILLSLVPGGSLNSTTGFIRASEVGKQQLVAMKNNNLNSTDVNCGTYKTFPPDHTEYQNNMVLETVHRMVEKFSQSIGPRSA